MTKVSNNTGNLASLFEAIVRMSHFSYERAIAKYPSQLKLINKKQSSA